MWTRASFSFRMGKVDFALSGAAELGVHRVHVHILTGKESKYVPLTDLVLLVYYKSGTPNPNNRGF